MVQRWKGMQITATLSTFTSAVMSCHVGLRTRFHSPWALDRRHVANVDRICGEDAVSRSHSAHLTTTTTAGVFDVSGTWRSIPGQARRGGIMGLLVFTAVAETRIHQNKDKMTQTSGSPS
jgi:hypothetical protein